MTDKQAVPFFRYVVERYKIFLRRRDGKTKPWTADPILQQYRFTNVFREDDRVTQWFRDSRERTTAFACALFRVTNRIDTGIILAQNNLFQKWNPNLARKVLRDKKPLVSAAYVVRSPDGMNKLEGVIKMMEPVWRDQRAGALNFEGATLQQAHATMSQYHCMGSFIAYEIVTDLNYTPVLRNATDRDTWAAAGPGAARGLARLLGVPLDFWNHHSASHQVEMLHHMQRLLAMSRRRTNWPFDRPWTMREVEHSACEWDKYERARLGEGRPKQRYDGGLTAQ